MLLTNLTSMKNLIIIFLSILSISFANAQESVKMASVEPEVSNDSTLHEEISLSNHRTEIQKLIVTLDSGIVRGYSFGTPVDLIKETEKAKFIADGKDFAIFKVDLNEKEYAEVIYYLDDKKTVKGFGIEFIIKEEDFILEENLVKDFQKFFTEKYGNYRVNSRNDEVWDGGTFFVEMGDASEGGSALEIEIEIFPKKA